jgi:monoterpene epsilon-lactone hydrolase
MSRSAIRVYLWYKARRTPSHELPFPEQRRLREKTWRPPALRGSSFESVEYAGVVGEWVAAPRLEARGTTLFLHGGGYLYGSARERRNLTSRISRAGACRVFALDYRLGPEHPFPAAVDDAVAAYRWLLDGGADPARIVIGGDSAGGGLAVSALIAARDAGVPLPAGLFLMSPWTDLTMRGESVTDRAERDVVLDLAGLQFCADLYLAGADPRHPLVSPCYADLTGLPPLLIQVGSEEMLFDDAQGLAKEAEAAGVDVQFEVWPGAGHVFQAAVPFHAEARRATARIGEFVRSVTDG